MTAAVLESNLAVLGRRLNAWQAAKVAAWCLAGAGLWLFAATAADLFWRPERGGRVTLWLPLLGWLAALAGFVLRELSRRRTPDGVAARVEAAHPEFDNRLINALQFARVPRPDALVGAYLKEHPAPLGQIDPARLKDRRGQRRASVAAAVAAVLVLLPLALQPRVWSNALFRVLNPFSDRAPSTLAELVSVRPGDARILNASPLVISLQARGRAGQPVSVEIQPADDVARVHRLGELAGGTEAESFAHDLPRVVGDLRYRVRAGDARSPWHTVTVLPPLAVSQCTAVATPPPHTAWESGPCKPLAETVRLPEGTRVKLEVRFNRPPERAAAGQGETAQDLAPAAEGAFAGEFTLLAGKPARLAARDDAGSALDLELGFEVVPDTPPRITVTEPQGRGVLEPGQRPRIVFQTADDFGLAEIRLEKVDPSAEASAPGRVLHTWPGGGRKDFSAAWSEVVAADGAAVAFRLVAIDNAPVAHTNRSPVIAFDIPGASDALEAARKAAAEAQALLARLIELQKKNLADTLVLSAASAPVRDSWRAATTRQEEVRALAGTLLSRPNDPLATLAPVLRDLHKGDMAETVDVLRRAALAEGAALTPLASRAVMLQQRILRVLTRLEENAAVAAEKQRKSDLLAMLDRLVRDQAGLLERARNHATLPPSQRALLVEHQDALSGEVEPFLRAARGEAAEAARNDAAFAEAARKAVALIETGQVAADMLRAAESLEKDDPAAAMVLQAKILTTLREAQNLLNAWRAAASKKEMEEAAEAVREAKEKFEKLADMKAKVNEAQRELKKAKDLSDKDMEAMQEEIDAMNARIEQAAMQIATDLHIFPELPVGNDLVEDVFTVYEEAKQVAGSETEAAQELGLQKEDFILDMLAAKTERLDGMEMWLEAKPDNTRRLTENFDQQEMPQIPVIPMATEFEDIIGDLLDQQESIEKESHDSATNQGSADMPEGWGIAEGEYTNFSAKGKSGNMRPDHNEQTGRSLVGREGQANGETAAGVGKINEGDPNIEARRTQDPAQSGQVQLEGHNDAKATGGGKLGGFDDEFGDTGAGPRRDAQTAGNALGLQAQLRRRAEEAYAKASLNHVKTGQLDEAILNMRRAEEALRKGYPIRQVREWQKRASASLKQTQAGLEGGAYAENIRLHEQPAGLDDAFASSPDDAPPEYRDLVSEYFKALGEAPAAP